MSLTSHFPPIIPRPADLLPAGPQRTLVAVLVAPMVVFAALNLLMGMMLFFGADRASPAIAALRFFDLNAEQTMPAWYTTVLLAFAAAAAAVTAAVKHHEGAPFVKHWYGLVAIFLYLSMDEALAIHERAIEPLQTALNTGGLFYFAWVIPGAVAVAAVGLIYMRFVFAQTALVKWGMIVAGAFYVGGALGLEMVGGLLFEVYGPGPQTDLVSMAEELAEMTGVIVVIYTLVEHLLTPRPTRLR